MDYGWRVELSACLFSLALILPMTDYKLASWWHLTTWFCLAFGFLVSPKSLKSRWVGVGVIVICLSAIIAIPGTIWWGDHKLPQTTIIALLTLPLVVFYLANNQHRVFAYLRPVFFIHAGVTVWHGLFIDGRASGITGNPNPAGAFLVLGSVYFLCGKNKWLALPLMGALPFTGARWSLFVVLAIIIGLTIARHLNWRYMASALILGAFIWILAGDSLAEKYRVPELSLIPVHLNGDISARLPLIRTPSFAPRGHTDDGPPNETPHNVPLRMAVETGILSGLAWALLGGLALWRTPRFDVSWWLLLAVVMLSMFYYFPWIERMGGFWWLLIGWRFMLQNQQPTELKL